MRKTRINKPDLTRSAKAISSAFDIKHTESLEIVAKGCGFDSYKEYTSSTKTHPHTGLVYLGEYCDMEQLSPPELQALAENLKNTLITETSNVILCSEAYFPFIEKEKQKKLERYKTSAGGYRARVYLGLFPYLYAYATGKRLKAATGTTDEVIDNYAKSLVKRFYDVPLEVQQLVLNTLRLGSLPSTKVKMAEHYKLLELFGFHQKPIDKVCFETNVIRYIGEDIKQNGDGSGLVAFLKTELDESDKRTPAAIDWWNDIERMNADHLGFKLIPSLAKPRAYKAPTELSLITKRLKVELGIEHASYKIDKSPYAGLTPSYPLMLTEKNFAPDLLLSRADLLSGVLIRGTTGSGSHDIMLILLSQLMSTNGGFIFLNGNGHLGDFHTLYSFAYAMNRERDIVFISRPTADHYSVEALKGLIAQNKLIYVYCGAMEKMPSGQCAELVAFVKRLTKATIQPRCSQDTPFTVASNNDMLYDRELKVALDRLDKICIERRYGRLFTDYGERYYHRKFYKERHYMFHALMHCEDEEECPHFTQRKYMHAGETIITMDTVTIREKTTLVYRTANQATDIILTQ